MEFKQTHEIKVTNRNGALTGGKVISISASYNQLQRILGKHAMRFKRSDNDGKVTAQWILEAGGKVAGIWDYKEEFICHSMKNRDRKVEFSIGGQRGLAMQIFEQLQAALVDEYMNGGE